MANQAAATGKTNHRLPGKEFIAIECPLVIKPIGSEQDGWNRLIDRLGGPETLSAKLEGRNPNHPVELQLGPRRTHYIHPIPGEWVSTNNILLKIVKRRRKPRKATAEGEGEPTDEKLYRMEPMGLISTTVRFRRT